MMGVAYVGIFFSLRSVDALWMRLVANTVLVGLYALAAWMLLRRQPVPTS
jgi:hypothetical protein